MQIVSCPSCGAEVTFRSHASVAVCEYCSTRVLKDADAVKDLGKMSSVLEDYSPIQIGTAGVLGRRPFTVVGRIQLRYRPACGTSGICCSTTAKPRGWAIRPACTPSPPSIRAMRSCRVRSAAAGPELPDQRRALHGAEIRVADCIGGQGELPFKVGDGYQARVADFRRGTEFITLDYSGWPAARGLHRPGGHAGQPAMPAAARRRHHPARRRTLSRQARCARLPFCGSPIKYLPGVTANLVCPSCATQIDAASPKARVVAAGERGRRAADAGTGRHRQNQQPGIHHHRHDAPRRRRSTQWNEYLMYGPRAGFSWLVETDEGWSGANVLSDWPVQYRRARRRGCG
jgi:hypothetical protein